MHCRVQMAKGNVGDLLPGISDGRLRDPIGEGGRPRGRRDLLGCVMLPTRNISTRCSISVHVDVRCLPSPAPSGVSAQQRLLCSIYRGVDYWTPLFKILLHGILRRSSVPRGRGPG